MEKLFLFIKFLCLPTSIIVLSFLSSCGGGGNNQSKAKITFNLDTILGEDRPLTSEERNIATRICYAYQAKSQKLRSPAFYDASFVFTAKNTDCLNLSTIYDIKTTIKYDSFNHLAYVPEVSFDPQKFFNRTIQTDSSGYLAQVCPKIFTNQAVMNTITQQNIKIQIAFFTEDLDGFLLTYFAKQVDNSYKIDSAETFKIPTGMALSDEKQRGIDQFYSTQKICLKESDPNKFSNYEQTLISR